MHNWLLSGRPPPRKSGLVIPLYSMDERQCGIVTSARESHPSVRISVIMNPCSGPGEGRKEPIAVQVQSLRSSGVSVLGYVPTDYGRMEVERVKSSVQAYKDWYSADGVFLDEVSGVSALRSYYREVCTRARDLQMKPVVGNPGQVIPRGMSSLFDACVVSEGPGLPSAAALTDMARSEGGGGRAAIIYAKDSLDQSEVARLCDAFDLFYVTELDKPDPYVSLGAHFADLVAMVETTQRKAGSTIWIA